MRQGTIWIALAIFLLSATSVRAEVQVTEIAWMGTADSQYGEWFELYNDGSESVPLAGWKLYEDGGAQLVFTLTKTIPAQGYLLVERTTASAPDPVPGINDEAGPFSGSGFANTGEDVVLKDAQGNAVHTLSYLSGWPAGSAESKQTMQWNGSKWITAAATPKASYEGEGEDTEDTEETPSNETPSKDAAVPTPKLKSRVDLVVPKTIYSTVRSTYDADVMLEYGRPYNGVFLWNMGDGTTYRFDSPKPVTHIYAYPGTYTISFAYYRLSYDPKPFLSITTTRAVTDPTMSFSVAAGKGFVFSNTGSAPFDLSYWLIVLPDAKTAVIPEFTTVAAKESVIMPFTAFGLPSTYTSASLQTPDGLIVGTQRVEGPVSSEVAAYRSPVSSTESSFFSGNAVSEAAAIDTATSENGPEKPKSPKTKFIVFGAVLVVVIGLFIGVERTSASRQEE